MGISISQLRGKVISRVKMLTGELMLTPEQKKLLRGLFSPDERMQMDAAIAIGKSDDIRLLCMLQFYQQDDFLDELLQHFSGKGFGAGFAQKSMVRFYSLVAASNMLSHGNFFDTLVSAVQDGHQPLEERCDIMCMMGSVFEQFGQDIHSREAAFTSEEIGGKYIVALLSILQSEAEPQEAKVASAMSLGRTVQNPSIRTSLQPTVAQQAFEALKEYSDIAQR